MQLSSLNNSRITARRESTHMINYLSLKRVGNKFSFVTRDYIRTRVTVTDSTPIDQVQRLVNIGGMGVRVAENNTATSITPRVITADMGPSTSLGVSPSVMRNCGFSVSNNISDFRSEVNQRLETLEQRIAELTEELESLRENQR